MVDLAAQLDSAGVHFGWLMPTPDIARRGLDLTPAECMTVQAEIWRLQPTTPVAVGLGPGYYHEAPFFPCAPLTLNEYNLDYRGNLTLCCQLSSYVEGTPGTDVVGNLHDVSLAEAVGRFHQRVATYLADKQDRIHRGAFGALDHFPCWYCVQYLNAPLPRPPAAVAGARGLRPGGHTAPGPAPRRRGAALRCAADLSQPLWLLPPAPLASRAALSAGALATAAERPHHHGAG
jgi:hypothetical protein